MLNDIDMNDVHDYQFHLDPLSPVGSLEGAVFVHALAASSHSTR